ncbi:hydantoinase/oxoprolinase family protein [uncultured Pseudokineococcus sp.]|uniref:hydantoinase/oxoprolinase family protein n=1 Tax=uncultured Pseudokineococcus sp. TaxID=1642928 RepID=UPI0026161F90|nr:hydantoinase/oxoprolinase family protein [uncultured Pseudokineococcus sp.]
MDIGGTFTDVISYDEDTGEYRAGKSSTTPTDLTSGVFAALDSLVDDTRDISFLVHGTTQGLNALLTRRGERVLVLATEGASHQLHIARGPRWRLYDLHYRKPEPLAPLQDILAVAGRFSSEGAELTPLDEDAVRAAAARGRAEGITAYAVCFLFSFRAPEHELRAEQILREELGDDVTISLSHRAAKEWREYERSSSAVVEAYTGPVVRRYLTKLERSLTERRLPVPLHVMQSSGGILTAESARRRPLQTLLSGPVGGAMGGAALAASLGRPNLICVDMGGTSFDVSLIVDGEPDVSPETTLEGLPMLMPVVNIHTVGAGGGSVAHLESGGLRVGPRSAGANPGPACYGRGGTEPTVTDANLVLGRVDPSWFAGGQMHLDVEAARTAVATVAEPLGLGVEAMAEGICDVANAKMAQAIRTITVARGIEPRAFSLVAFGGAGPMHAVFLAQELGIREVVVPRFPGAFSAWGMLQTSIRHDESDPYYFRDEDVDTADMTARLRRMGASAAEFIRSEGVSEERGRTTFSVDVRYVAQEYTLTVPLLGADEPLEPDFLTSLSARFGEQHKARFGHANDGAPIEVVALRATGLGDLMRAAPGAFSPGPTATEAPVADVWFAGAPTPTTLHRRSDLGLEPFTSPTVVVEETATTVVPPGYTVTVDERGTLVITAEEPA